MPRASAYNVLMDSFDNLNWDDLRYFLRLVQSKSLAATARAMGVNHSTISRRISALEQTLGAPLIIRNYDGIELTELGAKLAPHIEQVEQAVLALHGQLMQQKVRVRIAMPTGLPKLFTENLAQLRMERTDIALEFLTGSGLVDLEKGQADIAIRSGPVLDENLVARKLCELGWSLYASPSYLVSWPTSINLHDLSGHDIIGFDASLAATPPSKWIEAHARNTNTVVRSREITEMISVALSGAGLAILPCILADDHPGLVRLTSKVLASRELVLVYRREVRLAEPVQVVLRFVVQVMQKNAKRFAGHH
jgi:DNA-binding transcriptional LysR family regulator